MVWTFASQSELPDAHQCLEHSDGDQRCNQPRQEAGAEVIADEQEQQDNL